MKKGEKPVTAPAADDAAQEDATQAGGFDSLPPEAKKFVQMSMSMQRIGPMPHPLADKLNDGHIDKILEIAEKGDALARKDRSESRRYALAYVVGGVSLFVFLTVYLVGPHTEIYRELLEYFLAFLGGLGGGYWIRSRMDRK